MSEVEEYVRATFVAVEPFPPPQACPRLAEIVLLLVLTGGAEAAQDTRLLDAAATHRRAPALEAAEMGLIGGV